LNRDRAKEILLLYRPGTGDGRDPEIAEAIEFARQDPELDQWFQQQQTFQLAMRAKFREIQVPERHKLALLARQKIVRPPQHFWQRPLWTAAAAIFVALLSLAILWLRPSVPDRFSHYRENMVSAAVRMYGMDLETKDPQQLRQFIAAKGAPADYDLTKGLAQLPLKGGGLLRWRGNPVSMVCFDRSAGGTLFLFVMKRAALKDPPPADPRQAEVAQIDGLMTASWTDGRDAYVLAGPSEPSFAQKYLGAPH
jgi:hypothetical protein